MKPSLRSTLQFTALSIALMACAGAQAQTAWYYEMGGAQPIDKPMWSSFNAVPLQVSADISWNYSCGKFSMSGSVNKLLADVRSAADDYLNAMIANAQAAVASLPAIILQRANPTLYDIMQNGLLRAQASANAARLDCKALEDTVIANGTGAAGVWDNLKQAAKVSDWSAQASYSRNDVVTAQKTVDANAGKNGIAWIGNNGATIRAGGTGQPVIKLTADVMGAGYTMAVSAGNPTTNGATVKAGSKAFGLFNLFNLFPDKKSAQDYITEVIGETVATTTDTGAKTTTPGHGLRPDVARESARVYALIKAAVEGSATLTLAQREAISVDALVTEQLLRAIRDLPLEERDLIAVRLANEVALQNAIRKALAAVAMIQLGASTPNVSSNVVASEYTDEAIASVKAYIDDLMYEARIKKELVGETAIAILDRAAAQRTAPVILPKATDDKEPALGTVEQ